MRLLQFMGTILDVPKIETKISSCKRIYDITCNHITFMNKNDGASDNCYCTIESEQESIYKPKILICFPPLAFVMVSRILMTIHLGREDVWKI